MGGRVVVRHSVIVRVCHWINALCLFVLLMSGLQIFNAHPMLNWGNATDFQKPFFALTANDKDGSVTSGVTTLGERKFDTTGFLGASRDVEGVLIQRGFPAWATLPAYQDLATGRRWHFFFAWALVINGAVYLINLIALGHFRDFLPSARELRFIPRSIWDHVRLRFPRGEAALSYNVLQKLAYLSVLVALPILVLAGLTMSPGLDAAFPWLLSLFGGRQSARAVHFLIAAYLVAFFVIHLVMVLISGFANNMRSMVTGRYRIQEARDEA
jgi:thiosulfate reductase cytochrome b subunit